MAQFDANINIRATADQALKEVKKVEKQLKGLQSRTLSRAKKNDGLASNLITGGKAADKNVGARLVRQRAQAARKAVQLADRRVEKELRLEAALQRQETIMKALNRAGGPNNDKSRQRVQAALAASKVAKKNLSIQNAVNTLLEKELQIRREINRTRLASDEAKSIGRQRAKQVNNLAKEGVSKKNIDNLLKLNAKYVTAAEKGEADIAKAIDRRFKRKFKLIDEDVRRTKAAAKKQQDQIDKDAKEAKKKADKRKKDRRNGIGGALSGSALGGGFPLLFGGPSFSAAGGAIGGLFGALGTSAGFAAGIIGSALGAAFDAASQKAIQLGDALRSPTDNLQQLVDTLSIVGTETSGLIKDLEKLGASEIAASVATNELNARLDKLGVDPEAFKRDSEAYANALADLNIALAAFGVKLIPIVQGITRLVANIGGANFSTGASTPLNAQGAVQGAANSTVQRLNSNFDNINEEAARNQLLRQRLDTQEKILSAKEKDLRITSLEQVVLKGNLAIDAKRKELAVVQARARFEQNSVLKQQLQFEADILAVQLKQAQVQAENERARKAQAVLFDILTTQQKEFLAAAKNNLGATQFRQIDETLTGTQSNSSAFFELPDNFNTTNKSIYEQTRADIAAIMAAEQEAYRQRVEQIEDVYNLDQRQRDQRIKLAYQEYLATDLALRTQLRQLDVDKARLETQKLLTEQSTTQARAVKEQELATAQLASPLAMFDNMSMDNLGQGLGFFTETFNLADQQLQKFNQTLTNFDAQISDLKAQKEVVGITALQTEALDNQIQKVEGLKAAYTSLQPAINEVALQQQAFNDAFALLNPIFQNFGQNLIAIVEGTKSVEEAFADMLRNMGQMLVQSAATMIAQYIAIGIARKFAGIPGGDVPFTGTDSSGFGGTNYGTGFSGLFSPPGRATGGPVTANQPYIVGERGPELYVPNTSGSVVSNEMLQRYGANGGSSRTIRFESTIINNVEYVTSEQAMAMSRAAADDGAKRGAEGGYGKSMRALQNSRSQRNKLGMTR